MQFSKTFAAASLCGAVGGALGSPIFLVKARLQNQGNAAARFQYSYTGLFDGLRSVVRADGPVGLFRGVEAHVLRVTVGSAAQLSGYETCKRFIVDTGLFAPGVPTHLASALVAGLCVTTCMNPFDVVSTRLYSQQTGTAQLYRSGIWGPVDCLSKVVASEGVLGLYKGWLAHYMRLGPHTVFTFLFLEQFKRLAAAQGL